MNSKEEIQKEIFKMKKTIQASAVIGCVFKAPRLGRVVSESLDVGDFIDPTHKKIFTAIKSIVKDDKEPSKHEVAGYFTDNELTLIGGISTLTRLETSAPPIEKVMSNIRAVKEQTMRKKLFSGIENAKSSLSSMVNTKDIVKDLSNTIQDISSGIDSESGNIIDIYDEWKDAPNLDGVDSGFYDLDRLTGGFKPGTLWIVSAYLGTGKTMWLIKAMNNIQLRDKKIPCLFMSLEMQKTRLVKRMAWDLECNNINPERIKDFNVKLFNKKRSLADIEYTIMANRPKVVFIDYVQRIKARGNLFERMENVADELQRMAQEHNCCIVLASQVSNDHAREPSDILSAKGGQGLPASADVFIELSRKDMKRTQDEDDLQPVQQGEEVPVDMYLGKNRDGKDHIPLTYNFNTERGFISIPVVHQIAPKMEFKTEPETQIVDIDFSTI